MRKLQPDTWWLFQSLLSSKGKGCQTKACDTWYGGWMVTVTGFRRNGKAEIFALPLSRLSFFLLLSLPLASAHPPSLRIAGWISGGSQNHSYELWNHTLNHVTLTTSHSSGQILLCSPDVEWHTLPFGGNESGPILIWSLRRLCVFLTIQLILQPERNSSQAVMDQWEVKDTWKRCSQSVKWRCYLLWREDAQ